MSMTSSIYALALNLVGQLPAPPPPERPAAVPLPAVLATEEARILSDNDINLPEKKILLWLLHDQAGDPNALTYLREAYDGWIYKRTAGLNDVNNWNFEVVESLVGSMIERHVGRDYWRSRNYWNAKIALKLINDLTAENAGQLFPLLNYNMDNNPFPYPERLRPLSFPVNLGSTYEGSLSLAEQKLKLYNSEALANLLKKADDPLLWAEFYFQRGLIKRSQGLSPDADFTETEKRLRLILDQPAPLIARITNRLWQRDNAAADRLYNIEYRPTALIYQSQLILIREKKNPPKMLEAVQLLQQAEQALRTNCRAADLALHQLQLLQINQLQAEALIRTDDATKLNEAITLLTSNLDWLRANRTLISSWFKQIRGATNFWLGKAVLNRNEFANARAYLEAALPDLEGVMRDDALVTIADLYNWQDQVAAALQAYQKVPQNSTFWLQARLGVAEIIARQAASFGLASLSRLTIDPALLFRPNEPLANLEAAVQTVLAQAEATADLKERALIGLIDIYASEERHWPRIIYLGNVILDLKLKVKLPATDQTALTSLLGDPAKLKDLSDCLKANLYLKVVEALSWSTQYDQAEGLLAEQEHPDAIRQLILKQPALKLAFELLRAELALRRDKKPDLLLQFIDQHKAKLNELPAELVARLILDSIEAQMVRRDWPAAIQAARTPLLPLSQLAKLFGGETHISYQRFLLTRQMMLAEALIANRDFGQAQLEFRTALDQLGPNVDLASLSQNQLELLTSAYYGLGEIYRFAPDYRDLDKALKHYQRCLELAAHLINADLKNLFLSRALLGLAMVAEVQGYALYNGQKLLPGELLALSEGYADQLVKTNQLLRAQLRIMHQKYAHQLDTPSVTVDWAVYLDNLGRAESHGRLSYYQPITSRFGLGLETRSFSDLNEQQADQILAYFVSAHYQPTHWLTLDASHRLYAHFTGQPFSPDYFNCPDVTASLGLRLYRGLSASLSYDTIYVSDETYPDYQGKYWGNLFLNANYNLGRDVTSLYATGFSFGAQLGHYGYPFKGAFPERWQIAPKISYEVDVFQNGIFTPRAELSLIYEQGTDYTQIDFEQTGRHWHKPYEIENLGWSAGFTPTINTGYFILQPYVRYQWTNLTNVLNSEPITNMILGGKVILRFW